MNSYERKIIFSSGTRREIELPKLDESWEIACVRGPLTAERLSASRLPGCHDGAILLADLHDPVPSNARDETLFIPHITTERNAGAAIKLACGKSGIRCLSPSASAEESLDAIGSAKLVLAEAMHGAIVADTLRTPSIATPLLNHEEFKWRDWCASMEMEYRTHPLSPKLWDSANRGLLSGLRHGLKWRALSRSLSKACRVAPSLSDDAVFTKKTSALHEIVADINARYKVVSELD